jgi:transcriptional regulator with XRE-family HTH domain
MSSFAERLKELRKKAGLSQAKLAKRAGMHLFGVTKLEQGYREPTWATVQALAEALGVECTAFTETRKTRATRRNKK